MIITGWTLPGRVLPGCLTIALLFLSGGVVYGAERVVPDQFGTIQAAIDQADPGDTIRLRARSTPYREAILLNKSLILEGEETARVILEASGADQVITAEPGTTIQKVTIRGSPVGIRVQGSGASVTVRNSIIVNNDTGIRCDGNLAVEQSTIHNNDTGIGCSSGTVSIRNNLLTNNGTAIALGSVSADNVLQNGFDGNGNNGIIIIEEENRKEGDPRYVDPAQNDFHLRDGSPYRGSNLASPDDDLGAYGGSGRDRIPYRITGLTATGGQDSIALSWNANRAYDVTGYRVIFQKSRGQEQTQSVDAAQCCSFTLSALDNTVTAPDPPQVKTPAAGNQRLDLGWTAPPGRDDIATYKIFWGTASGLYDAAGSPRSVCDQTDACTTVSFRLSPLTNGILYFVAISAVARPLYRVSVTAVNSDNTESLFREQQVVFLEPTAESALSNEVSGMPEEITNFPALPDEGGCFIATAAYGSAWEPRVQVLRAFRDRVLQEAPLGRWFVSLYERYSPPVADFIRQHAWSRGLVRWLLIPLWLLALFTLKVPMPQQVIILTALVLGLSGYLVYRRRRRGWSGS